jgi:hypothetical protein
MHVSPETDRTGPREPDRVRIEYADGNLSRKPLRDSTGNLDTAAVKYERGREPLENRRHR